jgi:parvulin-like peptidyl-prolyl isomerase
VRIKQILLLFPDKADGETKAKLRADTAMLLKRLRNGEPFEQIAAAYSQGPASSSGGDMGFIEKGSMLPEVEDAAFKLGINEVSDVVESPVGLHIIKLVDRRGAGIKPLEAVREEIQAGIENEKLGKKYEEWMEELRKKSHIEIKL